MRGAFTSSHARLLSMREMTQRLRCHNVRTAKRNHPLSSWLAHAPTHARDVTWSLTITLKPWTVLEAHTRVILSLYLGMANFDLGEE